MLKRILEDYRVGMTEFQHDNFVTNKSGGTTYGMYCQALREIYSRFCTLRELLCDMEKLEVEIDEQKNIVNISNNDFEKRYAEIEHKRKIMRMEELQRSIEGAKREFTRFYQQCIYLKKDIGELTDKKREKLEEEMWLFKIKEMLVLDFRTIGSPSRSTTEIIYSCPEKIKKNLIQECGNPEKLIKWYDTRVSLKFPENLPKVELPNFETLKLEDLS